MEHRRMAPDTKILEELRSVYEKRPPETDGLGNLPASVFDFAAASKLNTKALTSEALSEGMGLQTGWLAKTSVYWLSGGVAVAATVLGAVWLIGRLQTPCLENAGIKVVTAQKSSFACEASDDQIKLILSAGDYDVEFARQLSPAKKRTVLFSSSPAKIQITGTKLKIAVSADRPAQITLKLESGKADLEMPDKNYPLTVGQDCKIAGTSVSFSALPEKSPKTLAEIRAKYGSLSRISLYSGREIRGAVVKRGEIYSVFTVEGSMQIKKDDIQSESPH